MKILKIENNISIVEYDDNWYVRKQFNNYKYDWSNYDEFDFDTNTSIFSLIHINDLEDSYEIMYKNYIRKLKIESL
ncbi:hypothetical protein M0Q50_07920 [bacterium]|jgi:hypothetical protein|nr:hypothetical protein [bacterium]